ncbi:MAG: hypothetical protein AB7O28_18105 [Vicinamibacterales bacterium]
MTTSLDSLLARVERDTVVAAVVLALGAAVAWPAHLDRALGVLGGLALVAVSYRGIRAGVDQIWTPSDPDASGGGPAAGARARRGAFVKFFTRHAILAAGAYVMIARFEFDPVAMLAGVSAPVVAVTAEIVRSARARGGGSRSRST